MVPISCKAKAPGTLMLCGEHAVLQNKRAIVFAIDQWIRVTLKTRQDKRVRIISALGTIEKDLDTIQIEKPFEFIFAAILHFKKKILVGFDLSIDSEFREDIGLGSSAAVTVAVVAVLYQFIEFSIKPREEKPALEAAEKAMFFEIAKAVIQTVQGIGSGADIAASVYGGILQYQQKVPYILKRWSFLLPIVVIYSGFKTPTPTVIKKVEDLRKKYPEIFKVLYDTIDHSVHEAAMQIEKEDWSTLGEIITIQQGLMDALGVGTPLLHQIVDKLNAESHIYGAKISGAGLGDCVIGIGSNLSNQSFMVSKEGVREIPLSISTVGVQYE